MLRILVATDGSPHALRTARAAAALAQAVQSAEVTVLTVAHAPLGTVVGLGAVTASGMAADYGGAAEAIFEEARATLDRTVEIFTAAGLAVTARPPKSSERQRSRERTLSSWVLADWALSASWCSAASRNTCFTRHHVRW